MQVNAQLEGVITDLEGNKISNASIYNLRTGIHCHSDVHGIFLDKNIRSGDTIKIRMLGFKEYLLVYNKELELPIKVILEEGPILLNQVNVLEPFNENLQKIDLQMNPVQNSSEMLKKVPGLFIAQHAGGGKAEQIFLRGFDIDHGTDINLTVDQLLPVNMVSHAHGQGYADLHFVIPELVQNIEFEKGSYNSSKGNFATAGSVNFKLKDHIHKNIVSIEKGMFNYNRGLAMINLLKSKKCLSYLAGELIGSRGYFDSSQDFKKLNIFWRLKYMFSDHSGLKLTSSFFNSSWLASGQIPEREVMAGRISRYGAIDDTEGGFTKRSNLMLQYYHSNEAHQYFKMSAYIAKYNFDLFSNFTFFLFDSIHGDQIRQKEGRSVMGFEGSFEDRKKNLWYQTALGLRSDYIDKNELSHTKQRSIILNPKSLHNMNENNLYSFVKCHWENSHWELQAQARADVFQVSSIDLLTNSDKKLNHIEAVFSPKLNLFYNLNPQIQIYSKNGIGFHSNDTRLLFQNQRTKLLTRSLNSDLGLQCKPFPSTFLHSALWFIEMEDELVYVGDEAVVESNGRTRRLGLEAGVRSDLGRFLDFYADASYTIAKNVNTIEAENYIPLAAKWTFSGGLQFQNWKNLSANFKLRFLGDRPAIEDYSIIAYGYTLCDATINYDYRNVSISAIIENIFNRSWNEAQFATLSKLRNESTPIREIHFTPGTPYQMRLKLEVRF